jgi:hypothetical protein
MWLTTGDLVRDVDTFIKGQVQVEVGTEIKSGVTGIGGVVRRWKYNIEKALRLRENINNQTEVQKGKTLSNPLLCKNPCGSRGQS